MVAQNIGIIYSANQQVIRAVIDTRISLDANGNRIVVPGDDSQLALHQGSIKNGEAWATVPCAIYDTHTSTLETHAYLGLSGIPMVTDRCIVISPNAVSPTVAAVVLGDPLIDTHPLGALVADTTGQAAVGLPVVSGVAQIPVTPPVTGGATA